MLPNTTLAIYVYKVSTTWHAFTSLLVEGVTNGPQSSYLVWHRSYVQCLSKSDSLSSAASCPAFRSCWWSAPGLACECSKLCDSPELRSHGCKVLCIQASLYTNPLSGEVPQCLPHLHQPACKNPIVYKLTMKFILRILRL